MQLSLKAMALAVGILWGGAILFIGVLAMTSPPYGDEFMKLLSSLYPGFHNTGSFGDLLIGVFYGLVDGAIGGLVFAWLYNLFAKPASAAG